MIVLPPVVHAAEGASAPLGVIPSVGMSTLGKHIGGLAFVQAAAEQTPQGVPRAPVEGKQALDGDLCTRQYSNEFQIYIENDKWTGTDQYYTNGLKFGFGTDAGTLVDLLNVPSESVLRRITRGVGCVQLGLFFGQNMYTPRRITVSTPQPNDRPWAAWLYVGGVAQRVEKEKLQTVEIDVGMVGPAALGRQVQTEWHELIGVDRPLGWDNQIANQPGLLLAFLEKRKYAYGNVEFVPHAGASIGNVMTLARTGGIVRWGRNMSGFGPDTIEPGGAMLQASRIRAEQGPGRSYEWYAFAGADVRAVAYNIFLDGPWFRAGPSVDRRVLVYDWTVGLSARISTVRFSLTRVHRSEEFTTPLVGGGRQTFQSFNLGFQF
jgi:Uncharacterized protein conserved in bacteria